MQSIGQEEWIGFRGKAYKKIMEFILKWQEKLKGTKTSPLTIKIHNELDELQVIMRMKTRVLFIFKLKLSIESFLLAHLHSYVNVTTNHLITSSYNHNTQFIYTITMTYS